MTEVTTLMFVGAGLGFIFGWFGNEYYSAFMESYTSQNMNVHPEMLNDQGFMIDEELLSVRFIDEEEYEED